MYEKYYVVGRGEYLKFNNIKDIFKYDSPAQPICLDYVGHNFNDTYIENETRILVSFVIYDKYLRVVDKETIKESLAVVIPWSRGSYGVRSKNYMGFRVGPVPDLSSSGYGFYNYHRSPKTTQELRLNCKYKDFTRGKRRNLRTTYDDVIRSDREIKQSWKKQKKRKQWM